MALEHSLTALNASTATLLTISGDTIGSLHITIQNVSDSAIVYLGTSAVTSSNFAFRLDPGSVVSIDALRKDTDIYGISNTDNTSVAVAKFIFS